MQKVSIFVKWFYFWPPILKYRFWNSKCREVKPRFDFIDIFCQIIKSFYEHNSMLRIHSKPTKFTQNRTEINKNVECVHFVFFPQFASQLPFPAKFFQLNTFHWNKIFKNSKKVHRKEGLLRNLLQKQSNLQRRPLSRPLRHHD